MRTLKFDYQAVVPDAGEDFRFIDFSVASDGGGLFLFVKRGAEESLYGRETGQGGASFAKTVMDEEAGFRLFHVSEAGETEFRLPQLDVAFPRFDIFPDGKVLMAAARCDWRAKDDFDLNGRIIDPATGEVERILLGDGIQDVFVDGQGGIWVSYFDEGIFGNFGWGGPGPAPVGASGVVCFKQNGEVDWRYPHDDICDCYAMSVSEDHAYIYYYTDFTLCRIGADKELTHWDTGLSNCRSLAADGAHVLLAGRYREPASTAYLMTVDGDRLTGPEEVTLVTPDGEKLENGKLVGRGAEMHFCTHDLWHRIDLCTLW